MEEQKTWHVYLLECLDGSYYTGISTNIEKRMITHQKGKGSKYVRTKGYKQLLYAKHYTTKKEASREEYRIKQLPKKQKLLQFK